MHRRKFIALTGGAAIGKAVWPLAARAETSKVYRIGTLTPGVAVVAKAGPGAILFGELAKRGYVPGQNLVVESRAAVGKLELMPQLMQELKAAKVDVVVTVGYPAAAEAKASGLPTVLAIGSGDPVKTGLVESFARPGGNVTGIADDASMLSTKRLSLLTALSPKLRRIAMLWNTDDLGMSLRYQASAKAAQDTGITVQPLGVREPDDFNGAFAAMTRDPPDAILMVSDSLTVLNRKRVIDFAAERRLPAIYEADVIVRDGGLMSYGAEAQETFERAAAMVDQILKGAKPADLPVEQPTRYQFVINLKAAKSIGLEIPPTLTALADEVIE
jgi:putative ABC transport system substrate-binding protein